MELRMIAEGLTKAQHTALWNLGCDSREAFNITPGWKEAPHDGYRRAGRACMSLCEKGLAEWQFNRRISPPVKEFRLNKLGREVRNYLG